MDLSYLLQELERVRVEFSHDELFDFYKKVSGCDISESSSGSIYYILCGFSTA